MIMDQILKLLEEARRGDSRHASVLQHHIQNFPLVILRGAGKFGTAFGAFLLQAGMRAEQLCYWDLRASELMAVNGVPVRLPFSAESERDQTLIINCIPNGSLSGSVGEQEFREAGYDHYLSGMALFEALMCGLKADTTFDSKVCIETTFCNWCACQRLPSLLERHCEREHLNDFTDRLSFPVATFAINQRCSLKCQHCGQYINHYAQDERINFPLERIRTDIERIFAAVDAIGYVSLIGGEPFLHPALNDVVDLVLVQPNFGVLGITTNGICEIRDEHLRTLQHPRTRLIFSDYTTSLPELQRRLFEKNVQRATEAGISFTVGQPLWSTPASLRSLNLPETTLIAMKAGCNSRHTCKTIQNGVYYPCSTTAAMGSHHLAEFPEDWVRIDDTRSAQELRDRIRAVEERTHYDSCDHCGEGGEILALPGEQGISNRYQHMGRI